MFKQLVHIVVIEAIIIYKGLDWLVGSVLRHINLCRLFKAKSIFMQIFSSISDSSVYHEYTV